MSFMSVARKHAAAQRFIEHPATVLVSNADGILARLALRRGRNRSHRRRRCLQRGNVHESAFLLVVDHHGFDLADLIARNLQPQHEKHGVIALFHHDQRPGGTGVRVQKVLPVSLQFRRGFPEPDSVAECDSMSACKADEHWDPATKQ
jgi:hypothetical protein